MRIQNSGKERHACLLAIPASRMMRRFDTDSYEERQKRERPPGTVIDWPLRSFNVKEHPTDPGLKAEGRGAAAC